MGMLIVSVLIFFIVVGILAFTLGGGSKANKTSATSALACPPGFTPSLAYKEKYGDNGIAYDEKQKAICILKPEGQLSPVIAYQNILAAAVLEDDTLTAKSVRADESGKQLLSHILSEDIKALFQNNTEQEGGDQKPPSGGISSSIEFRILVNNPEEPVHYIHFLNMEAKKGGVIHNEAVGHVKNWQDLLSYLIRLAGKPVAQPTQPPQPPSPQPSPAPETAAAGQS
ncbi:MAG: hypothetical protein O2999_14410 [Nitrospirae bacterium]|nr:hypothetical protein [Nitrospirota bacterium]MDA1305454.1 hypothetical protein [Nitrospirota bacterium]